VLADSGSNVDVISQQALEMSQVEVGNLVITPGEPMKIQLASREQVMDVSGDTVMVELDMDLRDHWLAFKQRLIVVPHSDEDIVLGIKTLASLELLNYMQDKLDPQEKVEAKTFEEYCQKDLYAAPNVLSKTVATVITCGIRVSPDFPDKVKLDDLLFPRPIDLLGECQNTIVGHNGERMECSGVVYNRSLPSIHGFRCVKR
jgi:hypothetical protein